MFAVHQEQAIVHDAVVMTATGKTDTKSRSSGPKLNMYPIITGMIAALAMTTFKGSTAETEHVHFRIIVPEFVNTHTHTKTVFVVPKQGGIENNALTAEGDGLDGSGPGPSAVSDSTAISGPEEVQGTGLDVAPISPGSLLTPEQVAAGHQSVLDGLLLHYKRHGKSCKGHGCHGHGHDKGHGGGHGGKGHGHGGKGHGHGGKGHGHGGKGHGHGGKGHGHGGKGHGHGGGGHGGHGGGGHGHGHGGGCGHGHGHGGGGHGGGGHGHGHGHGGGGHGHGHGGGGHGHGHGGGGGHGHGHGHGGGGVHGHGHGGGGGHGHGHGGGGGHGHGHGGGGGHGHGGGGGHGHGHGGGGGHGHGHGGGGGHGHGHGGGGGHGHGHGHGGGGGHGHGHGHGGGGGHGHGHGHGGGGGHGHGHGGGHCHGGGHGGGHGHGGKQVEGKSTLICSGKGTGNELLCVESKNFENDENKESKHFFDDTYTKLESYKAKDEKYKKKESLKHAAKEEKAGSSSGPSAALVDSVSDHGSDDRGNLTDENPTVSAEASNHGASVEDHPVGVGHVASFQQDYHHDQSQGQGQGYQPDGEQWIPIRPPTGPRRRPDSGSGHDVGSVGHEDIVGPTSVPDGGSDGVDGTAGTTPPDGHPGQPLAPASTLPTQVLAVSHTYQPLQTYIGESAGQQQGSTGSSVTMQYGDLTWSSVRGPGTTSRIRGRGRGRGRGSHLDGTEDALQQTPTGPSGYEVVERPADLSAEVHLTTLSPLSALAATAAAGETSASGAGPSEEAIALYYQTEEKDEAERDDDAELVETPPPRKRGRVRYGDRRRRKQRPRSQEEHAEHASDERRHDDDTARSSAEPQGIGLAYGDEVAIGVVRAGATAAQGAEELAQETNKLLEELKESKAVRKRLRKRPRIMTETGHILRGVEVKETLKADKWR